MKTVRSNNVESIPSENFFFSSLVVEKKKNDRKKQTGSFYSAEVTLQFSVKIPEPLLSQRPIKAKENICYKPIKLSQSKNEQIEEKGTKCKWTCCS